MIEEKIIKLAAEFAAPWSKQFEKSARLALDFSWPSIGVVEQILRPLTYKSSFSATDEQIILGAASYIGGIAFDCWKAFPDQPNVKLILREEKEANVILVASEGKFLKEKETFSVNISAALREVISSPKNPFPFFSNFSVSLFEGHHPITMFARGLCSGLTPFGKGGWEKVSDADFIHNLMAADDVLARRTANHYATLYPSESNGADANLYRSHLILPPAGYKEPTRYSRAVAGIIAFAKEKELDHKQIDSLAQNLMVSMDYQLAAVGYIVAAALCQGTMSSRLLAARETIGTYATALRPAVFQARSFLGLSTDWLLLVAKGNLQEAKKVFELDNMCGLLPLVTFDQEILEQSDYFALLHHLAWGELKGAQNFISLAKQSGNTDPRLILQGAFLAILNDEIEKAAELLDSISSTIKSAALDLQGKYALFRGEIAAASGNFEEATSAFEQSLTMLRPGTRWADSAALAVSRCAQGRGDKERAKNYLEELTSRPNSVYLEAMLDKIGVSERNTDDEGIKKLFSLAPNNPDVFSEMMRTTAAQIASAKHE